MSLIEIMLIGFGLAMDAMAVALIKGLMVKKNIFNSAIIVGLFFGMFQGLMSFFGYVLGLSFYNIIEWIDHFIIFILLFMIGLEMIKEGRNFGSNTISCDIKFKEMFFLSVATSIDAFAVGITFALMEINIFYAVTIVGIITFILSFLGVLFGSRVGDRFGDKAEVFGGIILILLGLKILLEHLFF